MEQHLQMEHLLNDDARANMHKGIIISLRYIYYLYGVEHNKVVNVEGVDSKQVVD